MNAISEFEEHLNNNNIYAIKKLTLPEKDFPEALELVSETITTKLLQIMEWIFKNYKGKIKKSVISKIFISCQMVN